MVNIEIEGARYGIDDVGAGGSGSVVAGATLRNQTVSAIRHQAFAPLTFVGFEIVTLPGSTNAALTTDTGFNQANFGALHLIDGIIRLGSTPTVAAIDNRSGNGKNFYARNVFITGGDPLIKSATNPAVSGTGTWKRLAEYSYCNQAPVNVGKISSNLIDGTATRTPGPSATAQPVCMVPTAPLSILSTPQPMSAVPTSSSVPSGSFQRSIPRTSVPQADCTRPSIGIKSSREWVPKLRQPLPPLAGSAIHL